MESFYAKVRNLIIPEPPQADEVNEENPILDHQSNLSHQKTEPNQFECLYCFGVFASSNDLTSHKRIHHQTKKYVCKWCNVTYSYIGWRYHYLKHTNDARYSCKSCNKKFILLQQLQSHLAHHKYSCSFCNETFVTIKQICAHRKSAHNIDEEISSFVPKLIQKRAKRSKNKWKIHRQRSLSEDFTSSHKETNFSLKNMRKSFQCNNCSVKFPKLCLLRDHIKKHWNCRPYSCHDCNSKFIQKKVLEKHVRKHFNRCSSCSKSFPNKNYLDVHFYNEHMQNVDLDIKNEAIFTCKYCGLTFQTEEDLQNHIKFTGENFIICARCINLFETESEFEFHLKTEHNIGADIPKIC